MLTEVIETLWFFLPAFVANQCSGFAAKLNLPGNSPVSEKFLGKNKTLAAYYVAPLGAIVAFYLQQALTTLNVQYGWYVAQENWEVFMIGALFGLGAVVGDHTKSYLKRLRGILSGQPWWPFDQIDFALGALLFIYPVSGWIGIEKTSIILVVAIALHPVVNWLGMKLGLRKSWR